MTQATTHSTQPSLPLSDVFSATLTTLFQQAQPGIVQVQTEQRGGGTGIIWSRDGQIITNNHVVGRNEADVRVHLADGRTLQANVVRRNARLDLALLKVTADNLTALSTGDSSRLRVGEWVFAIGHPWGQRWSLTAGIVSAISTVRLTDDLTTRYIKSDVRLAPGNSGGPLLDADGRVVGINAMIFGGDLSVSIPADVVHSWLANLPQRRGRIALGVELQAVELPPEIGQQLQLPHRAGLLIVGLSPQRQERYSDLLIGDILLEIGGQPINSAAALRYLLAQGEAGKRVQLTLVRGGTVLTVDAATITVEG
ncbi:MAG: trypsin-like peptidase domain-containing protein [Ktedonobacteraceae bacterium]|nr:trypsin-like peptidase domain-containing protein [Ktedonobacteraceae bacterium]